MTTTRDTEAQDQYPLRLLNEILDCIDEEVSYLDPVYSGMHELEWDSLCSLARTGVSYLIEHEDTRGLLRELVVSAASDGCSLKDLLRAAGEVLTALTTAHEIRSASSGLT